MPVLENETCPRLRLRCLNCGMGLVMDVQQVSCSHCGASWPVDKGIPRFFDPSYYWGEHARERAVELLEAAEREGWHRAVEARVAGNGNMLLSVLDWQRTAWLTLLGLGSDAVALDVGCGHGAITESLARTVGWVYALEAIPERLEFTRVRLQQEAIRNVSLVQASALDPPFPDKFFDLIVVNGVLEWVGEWGPERDPRAVQLGFLRRLHRILKDDGVVVIGIENRFGYPAFLGGDDHSGVPYTNLMPRALASLYLRFANKPSHRMTIGRRRQYRTYTYGERGYRRLLADSGFDRTRFYWADPGYNEPYHLVPLTRTSVLNHLRAQRMEPSQVLRTDWRFVARKMLGWTLRFLAPEFVIFARKGVAPASMDDPLTPLLRRALPRAAGELEASISTQSTYQFSRRNVILVGDAREGRPRLVLKASTPAHASKELIQAEFRNLVLVADNLGRQSDRGFEVPTPLGIFQVGRSCYAAQLPARGDQLHRFIARQPRSQCFARLRTELFRCIGVAVEIARMFHGKDAIAPVGDGWWTVPVELDSAPALREMMSETRSEARALDAAQHGDFTVENIFIEPGTGRLTVIDWENLSRGLPPLYDVLTLLLSVVPLVGMGERRFSSRRRTLEEQFLTAFFGTGRWTGLFRELLLAACEPLSVAPSQLWKAVVAFLILRINQFELRRSPVAAQTHMKFVVRALEHKEKFLVRT